MLNCEYYTEFGNILKPEYIISILALIVSIVALRSQRKHNVNTLKPIGIVECRDGEDDIYVQIKNAGSGPLLFKNLKVYNSIGKVEGNVVKLMPRLPEYIPWSDFLVSAENKALSPGNVIPLIHLSKSNIKLDADLLGSNGVVEEDVFSPVRKEVRKALSELTIKFEYSDVYGNNFTTSQKLDYLFGRHFIIINAKSL